MAIDRGYGSPKKPKDLTDRQLSAKLRKENIQRVAAKLAKAGKPLTGAQAAALGIAGGLGVGAATLIGGAASLGRRGGGSALNKIR